jgi:mono/diheme cytochrome c family protein
MKNVKFILLPLAVLILVGGIAYPFLFRDPHVTKGGEIFFRYCSPCHGESGSGNGYNAKNLDPHPRDLTDSEEEYMAKLSNKEIYDVLVQGGAGVGLSALMPAWGKVFSEEELWSIVAYVRTLHKYKGPKVEFPPTLQTARVRLPLVTEAEFNNELKTEAPTPDKRDELIALGQENFSDYGCIACHTIGDEGGKLGPNLSHAGFMLQTQFIYRWVRNPQAIKPNTRMPNLGLPNRDALAVALYLTTLNTPNFVESPPSAAATVAHPKEKKKDQY